MFISPLQVRSLQISVLTDGPRVAAQHVVVFGSLLLNAALHVAERSLHPLRKALLDLTVVLLHLQLQSSVCLLVLIMESQKGAQMVLLIMSSN